MIIFILAMVNTDETFFKASPGRVMFAAGLFFSALLLGGGGFTLYTGIMLWPVEHGNSCVLIGVGLLFVLLFPVLLFFIPRGYRVTPTALLIVRGRSRIAIPFVEIRELRRIKLPYYVKTNGTNGFFGDCGQFTTYSNSLGFHDFTAYLTRNDTEVVIYRKHGEPVVLSPDQPEEFIAAVMERVGVSD